MKWTFLPALFLTVLTASAAQAQPFNGADCVAAADKDLNGQTLAVAHTDDPTVVSAHLTFAPKSIFVATGYAVKVFAEPEFKGASEFDGTLLNVDQLKTTAGGHYVNIGDQYLDHVGSFACVSVGKLWPNVAAFHARGTDANGTAYDQPIPVVFYPGQEIATTGDGYHSAYGTVTVAETDGHKLVSFAAGAYYQHTIKGTLDLESGALTIQIFDGFYPYTQLSSQTVSPNRAIVGIDFQYKGALDILNDILTLVITNEPGGGPGGNRITVPNLELQSLQNALLRGFRSR